MRKLIKNMVLTALIAMLGVTSGAAQSVHQGGDHAATLKAALADHFLIGTALNEKQLAGKDSVGLELALTHFNTIVGENCMKASRLQPSEGVFDFRFADQLVALGEKNGMTVIGHTLIWHSQLPRWFGLEAGKQVSPDLLKQRMKTHIETVVKRYKGRVKGWDVVNEALNDDGTYRHNIFYELLGESYLPLAFQYAHEADPNAELYYNDYSMALPAKREGTLRLLKLLKAHGVRVDAVGMQGHLGMDRSNHLKAFEASIVAFAAVGVKVMVTELDMSVLPWPGQHTGADISQHFKFQQELNPYADGLPDDVSERWNKLMYDYFQLFIKHAQVIDRVTVWGVADGDSWKNNWPMMGRTDYPLLFDRQHQAKPVVEWLIRDYGME
ncbi:endo-1,4-beta-xylanase [Parapedobacter sp. 2B3]|uniref:endo-1,4-beta-xylanase n=1 Tax=Parapedobacter sp. 2B3 TaxID=3342381 RepID=UPI0035B596F7